ncbi:MAG: UDP-3-O-(3-hydroxymyristoyl)glucosamine N-acyltransferase [Thermoanaerobaculia bacterium]
MTWTLGQLAERVRGEVEGSPGRSLEGVRTLAEAGPSHLSFLTSARFLPQAAASAAGAMLVDRKAVLPGRDLLRCDHPQLALAEILRLFHPVREAPPGIHTTAVVGAGCTIDPSVVIGPYVVLGTGVEVAAGAVLHPHVVVGDGCRIGAGSVLHPHVVLYAGVSLAERVEVHAGTVLGSDGFGYATVRGVHHKIPQVGGVDIGADVEIGALTTIDRALLGSTSIGAGSKIDNLVQVGHNVVVGERAILCGQAGIAGSARLGDGVVLAGQAGVAGHLEIGSGAQVAAKSAALSPIEAGQAVAGIPAVPIASWRRQQSLMRRLPEIWKRLRALERRVGSENAGEAGSGSAQGGAHGGEDGSEGGET